MTMHESKGESTGEKLVALLHESARYFENRPTNGEDMAHCSNVTNAENCRKAAALLDERAAEIARVTAERDEARAEARDCHKVKEKIYVIGIGHAERATAAEAREAALREALGPFAHADYTYHRISRDGWTADLSDEAKKANRLLSAALASSPTQEDADDRS